MKKQIKKAFALSLLLVAVLWLNTRTVLAEEAYVATVTTEDGSSTTNHTSLDDAISEAEANEGSTVTLANDISTDTYVTIDSGTVTIDLNGHCWESSSWALYVEGTAKVTITDTSQGKSGVLRGTGAGCPTIPLQDYGALTFSGGMIEHTRGSDVIAISNSGGQNNATFEMNGGILKTLGSAIEAYGASVTITGGTIEADIYDIFWLGGTIDLSGYSSADGFAVDRRSDATTTIDDITLPEGYVLADRNMYAVDDFSDDSAAYATTYIVKQNNTKTITFDANGGTGTTIPSTNTTVEGKLTSLPGAAHETMYLKGWYDEKEGGTEITPDYVFTENTEIYAQYADTCSHYTSNITNGKCVCGKGYIYVELADSFGDGWNRNAIKIVKNGEEFQTMTITSEQRTAVTYLLEYDSSANYLFKWIKGDYPDECSYKIYIAGEMVATQEDCSSYDDGEPVLVLGFVITKQPTADNPTVSTNDENATCQWYLVEGAALNTSTDTLLTGETANMLATHEVGKRYACLVTFSNGTTEASDVVYYPMAITTQPTVFSPTVVTNDTGATYQWYEVSPGLVDVTMENIFDVGFDFNFNSEGWFESVDLIPIYAYFTLELKAGDVLKVSTYEPLESGVAMLNMENSTEEFHFFEPVDSTGQAFSIEAPEDGIWIILTMEENRIQATVSSLVADMTKPVANGTGATLQNPVIGKSYACVVTFADGSTAVSNAITYTPEIITQPTASNPTVVTNDDNATYQWYEATEGLAEVTNQTKGVSTDIAAFMGASGMSVNSTYTNGAWIPAAPPFEEITELYYFVIELEQGDELTINFKEAPESVYCYVMEEGENWITAELSDTTATFTAPEANTYCFAAEFGLTPTDVTATAYIPGMVPADTPISGETAATLKSAAFGKSYVCVVTFSDNTTKTSEVISYDEATFLGTNITLKDTIDMNFYVKLPELPAGITGDPVVKFTVNGTEKATVGLADAANNGEYKVTYNVAAKEMTDEITAELMVGETVVASCTTSVREYAETILADTENATYTAETQELVKAMLNYGAYAQAYFDYNTSNPANAGYENMELAVNTAELRSYVPAVAFSTDGETANYTSTNGITYVGSSLLLESRIIVRHYFDVGENTNHGLTNKIDAGYYYVDTAVTIADMEVGTSVKVDDYTVTYSPLNYITTVLCSKADSELMAEENMDLQNLVKALYLYYKLADTYTN